MSVTKVQHKKDEKCVLSQDKYPKKSAIIKDEKMRKERNNFSNIL